MDLVIKTIDCAPAEELPPDSSDTFAVSLRIEIGVRGEPGGESFYFLAASPSGLEGQVGEKGFALVRGLILIERFDLEKVRRAVG
ncbi:MAG TPA: Imm8 family immunity protein [Blastocatellia bacterium]|nr:Imm8 family immunity protein [Blastocatellia bacterium]